MKKTYQIEVDCANCANLMEEATKKATTFCARHGRASATIRCSTKTS